MSSTTSSSTAAHRAAVSAGDLERTAYRPEALPIYLGTGRLGGCFDAGGLQSRSVLPSFATADATPSRVGTVLTHKEHLCTDHFGQQRLTPIARLGWSRDAMIGGPGYRQRLSLFDGHLSTTWGDGATSVEVLMSPDAPDCIAVRLRAGPGIPDVAITAVTSAIADSASAGALHELVSSIDRWVGEVRSVECSTAITVRLRCRDGACGHGGQARLEQNAQGCSLTVSGAGELLLVVGIGSASRLGEIERQVAAIIAHDDWAAACADAWHRRWQRGGWIQLADARVQRLWARSIFWQLCSSDGSALTPPPPCGLSGLAWQFSFSQDISFIAPALLRLGHADLVRGWVDWHASMMPEMREFTRRLYRHGGDGAPASGVTYPFENLIRPGGGRRLMADGREPHHFIHEHHNAFYPARMAWETARLINDPGWTRHTAWPQVQAAAEFYVSGLRKGTDGLWGFHLNPGMGQEEFDGRDQADYLCALSSARACLDLAVTAATELGIADEDVARWRRILADGVALPRLRHRDGYLCASPRRLLDATPPRMKTSIQLHPLLSAPRPDLDLADVRAGYAVMDQQLDVGDQRPRFSWAWQLESRILAAVQLGHADDVAELTAADLDRKLDDEHLTLMESTHPGFAMRYFTTGHGFLAQAIQNALVDDTLGATVRGRGMPAAWGPASFHGLRTQDGLEHTGTVHALARLVVHG